MKTAQTDVMEILTAAAKGRFTWLRRVWLTQDEACDLYFALVDQGRCVQGYGREFMRLGRLTLLFGGREVYVRWRRPA